MTSPFLSRSMSYILGFILALLSGACVFFSTDPAGDSHALIAEVEKDVGRILDRHGFVLRDAQSPNPRNGSRTLYRMAGERGELIFMEGPVGHTPAEVEPLFTALYASGRGRYVLGDLAYAEIRRSSGRLLPANGSIVEAKALTQFYSKPRSAPEAAWQFRFANGNQLWRVQEPGAYALQRALYAGAAGLAIFVLYLVCLALSRRLGRFRVSALKPISQS